ncbi:MAG TPA: hypothetical protein VHS09_01355, partial [Polyangiaceae bacterium]|nr:hypothetical protein [Polyangiaceae bacterium]
MPQSSSGTKPLCVALGRGAVVGGGLGATTTVATVGTVVGCDTGAVAPVGAPEGAVAPVGATVATGAAVAGGGADPEAEG